VILPLLSKDTKERDIGIVEGDYEYNNIAPKIRHIKKVKWLDKGIARPEFTPLTFKFLSLPRTVFTIKSNDAINNIINNKSFKTISE
jgi:predicted Mrr-cat superfamily restriction endonuclease